jgi:photosystem II stability/assembly factor-like uncharacterized protein
VRGLGAAVLALAAGLGAVRAADPGAPAPAEWAVPARLAPESLLLDVARHGERLVAVGERGHVLVSTDGGATWAQARVPTRALLTGVFMHDESLAWAVGHDAVVLRTRDGGETWERVHHDPDAERPLLDVWFEDAQRGLAASAYGELVETKDGGASWERRPLRDGEDFHVNQLAAAADGTLYAAAEAGHLYRSDDRGATWSALPSPYEGSFFGVLPLAEGPVLAYGLRGRLFSSTDRGGTWTRLETGSEATLLCALQTGPGRFVVAGMEGTLVFGDSPAGPVRAEERRDRHAIVALAPGPGGSLLLFGEGGVERVEPRD